jgi:cobalt-zinc-cadmium efflux system outer membrane protein
MKRHTYSRPALVLLSPIILGGCATVDPTPDYLAVGERVKTVTGQEEVYQPGYSTEEIRSKVEELLADGVKVDDAVKISLLNNPHLQAAFLDVGMARADVVQAGLWSNPSLGVALRLPAGGGLAAVEGGLAQNIADLWQMPARKAAAERSLNRAILRLARRAADLVADTKIAFYEALGAEQAHTIGQENVGLVKSVLDLAVARREAGAGTELDVNLARSVMLDAELAAESARLASADARRDLAELLGLTLDAGELELVGALPEVPPELPDAETLVAMACVYCLDIQAARQAVAVAEAQLKEEYRRVLREVEVGVEFEREARQREGGRDILADTVRSSIAAGRLTAPEIQPRSERGESTDFVIGPSVALELPIFDQNQAQIAKAKYAYDQAVKELEALERAATQEVRSSVDRVLTSWKLAQMYRDQSIPLAEQNLELSREVYRAGRGSFLAVLEAQRLFLESRSHAVEASRTAATTAAEMERTMCLPLSELVSQAREKAVLKNDAADSGVTP